MSTPALILIHGYPLDHTLWDHVVALLDKEINVVAPDLRGFGDAPVGNAEPAIERYAADIAELLEKKNISRAVVAGMSMGGYVALAFAEQFKEKLAGLALVNSHPFADTDDARAKRREMIETVKREGPEAAAKAVAAKLFSPGNSGRTELARFPLAAATKAGKEGICWALEAMARRNDRAQVLKNLEVPVLILHGAEDQLIPAERAREVAKLNPSARYVELPGVGHCSPLEDPKAVAKAMGEFVLRNP